MNGTTAATIPIRDVNGRMQAADPASGATDKSLTTANWVSQTGDSAPNNLLHKTGDENIYNEKIFNANGSYARPIGITNTSFDNTSTTATASTWIWIRDTNNSPIFILMFIQNGNQRTLQMRTYKADGTYQQDVIAGII